MCWTEQFTMIGRSEIGQLQLRSEQTIFVNCSVQHRGRPYAHKVVAEKCPNCTVTSTCLLPVMQVSRILWLDQA